MTFWRSFEAFCLSRSFKTQYHRRRRRKRKKSQESRTNVKTLLRNARRVFAQLNRTKRSTSFSSTRLNDQCRRENSQTLGTTRSLIHIHPPFSIVGFLSIILHLQENIVRFSMDMPMKNIYHSALQLFDRRVVLSRRPTERKATSLIQHETKQNMNTGKINNSFHSTINHIEFLIFHASSSFVD